ncbi:protein Dok-7 isoform X3 [Erinaceus europaeus]|uniref:Protein Dok-7 isoform X3 n=1 Tax=Erinaceus europaeus TaxID=9365 RepID=A0ABM3WUM1_ERIEU|nr:protein Dok-7 isoform X3 [Erinaceus europaeus]
MSEAALVEGQVKLRDGKKWKTRWLVLRRPSPVADCLLLLAYKDRAERARGLRELSSLTLEQLCGLEPGLPYDGLAHTLALLCPAQAVLLGFDSREAMCAWDARLRQALGEVHRFPVTVAPGTRLDGGPATLHLCNDLLAVARHVPPVVSGRWRLPDLRRFGAVPGGFIFEGGTRCGYWAGVFFLSTAEGEHISFLVDCIVRGVSPSRGPFGLRPVLPGDPGAPAATEDLEMLQLEKRLSLLAQGATGCPGDDRSLSSSSSEASHSDVSAGSRLGAWPEASSSSAATSQEGLGAQAPGEAAGPSRPPPRPPRPPRQLQEAGRQGSSDSGIATGSCSSCAGSSLDVWRGAEECARPPAPCACPPASEYQVPGAPRPHYDTPRSLRQLPRDPPAGEDVSCHQPRDSGDPPAPSLACPVCGGLKVNPPP